MKIMLATESRGWSGGAAQTLHLAKGLASRGHGVWLACRPESDIGRRAAAEGIRCVPVAIRGDADLLAALAMRRVILGNGIEILHAQHPKAHGAGLLTALLCGSRLKFLVTRRVSFPVSVNRFSRWKYTSRRIDALAAVSEGIRDVLLAGGCPPERTHVIYSGVDPSTFLPSSPETLDRLRSSIGLVAGVPAVIKVANFADWKGQDVFLAAAAKLVQEGLPAQFVLAGRGTDSPECLGRVDALGLRDHVKALGFRTDVADLLSISTLSVNSARGGEGLSGALRESLALGVPVVATDVSGNRELVIHDQTGLLVPPGDPGALAGAIRRMLERSEDARRLAQGGRRRVLAEFTVDRMVEKTEQLYRKVLELA